MFNVSNMLSLHLNIQPNTNGILGRQIVTCTFRNWAQSNHSNGYPVARFNARPANRVLNYRNCEHCCYRVRGESIVLRPGDAVDSVGRRSSSADRRLRPRRLRLRLQYRAEHSGTAPAETHSTRLRRAVLPCAHARTHIHLRHTTALTGLTSSCEDPTGRRKL